MAVVLIYSPIILDIRIKKKLEENLKLKNLSDSFEIDKYISVKKSIINSEDNLITLENIFNNYFFKIEHLTQKIAFITNYFKTTDISKEIIQNFLKLKDKIEINDVLNIFKELKIEQKMNFLEFILTFNVYSLEEIKRFFYTLDDKIIKSEEITKLLKISPQYITEYVQLRKNIQNLEVNFSIEAYLKYRNNQDCFKEVRNIFSENFKKIYNEEKIKYITQHLSKSILKEELYLCLKNLLDKFTIEELKNFFSKLTAYEKTIFIDLLFTDVKEIKTQFEFIKMLNLKDSEIIKKSKLLFLLHEFNKNITISSFSNIQEQCYKISQDKFILEIIEKEFYLIIENFLKQLIELKKIEPWFYGNITFKTNELNLLYDQLRIELIQDKEKNIFEGIKKLKDYLKNNDKPYINSSNNCLKTNKKYFLVYPHKEKKNSTIDFHKKIVDLFIKKIDYRYPLTLIYDYLKNNVKDAYNFNFSYVYNNLEENNDFIKKFINDVCLATGMKRNTIQNNNEISFSALINENCTIALAKEIKENVFEGISVEIFIEGISNYTNQLQMKKDSEGIIGGIKIAEITTEYLNSENFRLDLINLIPSYNRRWDHVNVYKFYYEYFNSDSILKEDSWSVYGNSLK